MGGVQGTKHGKCSFKCVKGDREACCYGQAILLRVVRSSFCGQGERFVEVLGWLMGSNQPVTEV